MIIRPPVDPHLVNPRSAPEATHHCYGPTPNMLHNVTGSCPVWMMYTASYCVADSNRPSHAIVWLLGVLA